MNMTKNTTMDKNVQGTLMDTTEEIRTAKRRVWAKITVAAATVFEDSKEKPFDLDLSPAMRAKLFL